MDTRRVSKMATFLVVIVVVFVGLQAVQPVFAQGTGEVPTFCFPYEGEVDWKKALDAGSGLGTILTTHQVWGMPMHPDPNMTQGGLPGVDIYGGGKQLRAACSGTVHTGQDAVSNGGNYVRLMCDQGWTVVGFHLDSFLVQDGQPVQAGQPIGIEGHTSSYAELTEDHTHFVVGYYGSQQEKRDLAVTYQEWSQSRWWINPVEARWVSDCSNLKSAAAVQETPPETEMKQAWQLPTDRCAPSGVPFGQRNDAGHQDQHTGVDFGCPSGLGIQAVADGEVVWADWWPVGTEPDGHGETLWVYHGAGADGRPIYSVYAHLSQYKVKVGDVVRQGEVVALSGATGYGEGAHLHFAVARKSPEASLVFSDWDDPNSYLGKQVEVTGESQQSDSEGPTKVVVPGPWDWLVGVLSVFISPFLIIPVILTDPVSLYRILLVMLVIRVICYIGGWWLEWRTALPPTPDSTRGERRRWRKLQQRKKEAVAFLWFWMAIAILLFRFHVLGQNDVAYLMDRLGVQPVEARETRPEEEVPKSAELTEERLVKVYPELDRTKVTFAGVYGHLSNVIEVPGEEPQVSKAWGSLSNALTPEQAVGLAVDYAKRVDVWNGDLPVIPVVNVVNRNEEPSIIQGIIDLCDKYGCVVMIDISPGEEVSSVISQWAPKGDHVWFDLDVEWAGEGGMTASQVNMYAKQYFDLRQSSGFKEPGVFGLYDFRSSPRVSPASEISWNYNGGIVVVLFDGHCTGTPCKETKWSSTQRVLENYGALGRGGFGIMEFLTRFGCGSQYGDCGFTGQEYYEAFKPLIMLAQ